MPNCGPTAGFMEQILWVRMRWGGRVMVSSPATGYPFFPPSHLKRCDSAWWSCEDIKMAIWDMLMLVSQLSFWKHKNCCSSSVWWHLYSAKMFLWAHVTKEWERSNKIISVTRSFPKVGWTLDKWPCKMHHQFMLSSSPFPPSWSWFMMNFADLLAVNQKRKSSSISPFAPFFSLFRWFLCYIC